VKQHQSARISENDFTEPEKIAELLDEKADKAIPDAINSTWR
jgi:hypothetical protein